jgi:hypothetical protein
MLCKIVTPFFDQLNEDEKMYGHVMQGSATAHTANNSMNVLPNLLVNE